MNPDQPDSGDEQHQDDDWASYLDIAARDIRPPEGLAHWRQPDPGDPGTDRGGTHRPSAGSTVMLDVVAAIDYFSRGLRPGFGVWDAIEEAVRWWVADHYRRIDGADEPTEPHWNDPDPLRRTLEALQIVLDDVEHTDETVTIAAVLDEALGHWVIVMAQAYNAGYTWPHPLPRRGLPPPLAAG